MLKLQVILSLILGIHVAGHSQWEQKNISTNSTLTGVTFINNDVGFVTGGNRIFKTADGGDSWISSHIASDLVAYEAIFAINDEKVIAVGKDFDSNKSIITKTENGGTTWTVINILNSSFLKSVFFSSTNVGYCSGSNGTILKSTDSGNSWQELNSGTGLNLQSIYFANETVGIAVGGSPTSEVILKTKDGGMVWSQINSPSNNNLQSVFLVNQDSGYVVGWNGEIMKTTDCGDSWTIQNSVAMTGNLEVIFTDEGTGYIVGGAIDEALIQKTSNGGALWEDVSPQVQEGLTSIHFSSFNVGYAVGSNGTVVKTESGGGTTASINLEMPDEIKIYPNPTNGNLIIQSENNQPIEELILYDSNGRIIRFLKPYSSNLRFDLSDFDADVYFLKIHTNKSKSIKRIVKK